MKLFCMCKIEDEPINQSMRKVTSLAPKRKYNWLMSK